MIFSGAFVVFAGAFEVFAEVLVDFAGALTVVDFIGTAVLDITGIFVVVVALRVGSTFDVVVVSIMSVSGVMLIGLCGEISSPVLPKIAGRIILHDEDTSGVSKSIAGICEMFLLFSISRLKTC